MRSAASHTITDRQREIYYWDFAQNIFRPGGGVHKANAFDLSKRRLKQCLICLDYGRRMFCRAVPTIVRLHLVLRWLPGLDLQYVDHRGSGSPAIEVPTILSRLETFLRWVHPAGHAAVAVWAPAFNWFTADPRPSRRSGVTGRGVQGQLACRSTELATW
jgi:hypothetical protein